MLRVQYGGACVVPSAGFAEGGSGGSVSGTELSMCAWRRTYGLGETHAELESMAGVEGEAWMGRMLCSGGGVHTCRLRRCTWRQDPRSETIRHFSVLVVWSESFGWSCTSIASMAGDF